MEEVQLFNIKSKIRNDFIENIIGKNDSSRIDEEEVLNKLQEAKSKDEDNFKMMITSIVSDVYQYLKWQQKQGVIVDCKEDIDDEINEEDFDEQLDEEAEEYFAAESDMENKFDNSDIQLLNKLESVTSYDDIESIVFDEEMIGGIASNIRDFEYSPSTTLIAIKNNMQFEKVNTAILKNDAFRLTDNMYYCSKYPVFSKHYVDSEYIGLYNNLLVNESHEDEYIATETFQEVMNDIYYYNYNNYRALLLDMCEKYFINTKSILNEKNIADNFMIKCTLNLIANYSNEEIENFFLDFGQAEIFIAGIIENFVNYNCPYTDQQIRDDEQIQSVKRKLREKKH